MNVQRLGACVTTVCVLFLPTAAWSQVLTGSIAGVVRDTTGAVLPGVTVEAASPALIEKVRSVVTDDRGLYRIIDLRPGLYSVTFTLPGFGTVRREGIELTSAFTATVNADLPVGALAETITVSGAAPIVDVQNTVQRNVFTRESVEALPVITNNEWAYATLIPAARLDASRQDVGGNQTFSGGGFSVHGSPGTKRFLDGMPYNNLVGTGNSGAFFNNAAMAEEINFQTGNNAETQQGGVQLNVVPKEGGNRFSAYFISTYTNSELQAVNITDELRARGLIGEVGQLKAGWDIGGGVGGPIKRDKLWFYSAHKRWFVDAYVPGMYPNATQDSWFYTPDLSQPAFTHSLWRDHSIRLTWQASQKNKFNFTFNGQRSCNCPLGFSGTVTPEAVPDRNYHINYPQFTWNHVASNRLLLEAGAGAALYYLNNRLRPGVSPDHIGVTELSTNLRYRSYAETLESISSYGKKGNSQSSQRFSVSYVTGSHSFKTGLFMMEGWTDQPNIINQSRSYTFRNGVPQSVTLWAMPHESHERLVPDLGIYAQDQWTVRKLTLNYGLRFDYLRSYVPEHHLAAGEFVPARDFARLDNVPNWKDVRPRVSAAYDLFGTGRTAFKVQLGQYSAAETTGLAQANNRVNSSVNNASRTWSDDNGNFVPDCDLRNPVANGECGPTSPSTFGQTRIATRYADDVLLGWGNRGYNWQGSVSMQHELMPGVAVDVGYFRTWYGNFTTTDNLAVTPADYDPFCITAPVDPRLPGGGGNQICGLYDIKPAKFGQVDNLVTQASNFGKQTQVFNGVDVTLRARFGQGGQLTGGVSTAQTVTDNCEVLVDSPQKRFCKVTEPWAGQTQMKFSGAYPLPWDVKASGTLQILPGIPRTASFVATNAQIAPSLGRNLAAGARGTVIVDLIEPNTLYEDRIKQLDVRLSRTFRTGSATLQGNFDVYNIFNTASILQMTTRYGPAWLRPARILGGRLFRVGVQVDF